MQQYAAGKDCVVLNHADTVRGMTTEQRSEDNTNEFLTCCHVADSLGEAADVSIVFTNPALRRSFKNQYLTLCPWCMGQLFVAVRELHLMHNFPNRPTEDERG